MRVKLWSRDGRDPLLRRARADRPAVRARRGGAGALRDRRRGRRAQRPGRAREPLRAPGGQAAGGAHADPHARAAPRCCSRSTSASARSRVSASRLLRALAPPLVGGLLVLLLFQVPLAWSLARRLQRGHEERERLLAGAIEASERERRRIAADLHDGVVQDLAGVAFGLAPLAADARRRGDEEEARVLSDAVDTLRQGVRDMRTLLVEIHPPRLETGGPGAGPRRPALARCVAPGIETSLSVRARAGAPTRSSTASRARRCAMSREHAGARSRVTVVVTPARLDGRPTTAAASTPPSARAAREEGHVGLSLLEDLVAQSGGRLTVDSAPGAGTTVTLEVRRDDPRPARRRPRRDPRRPRAA